MSWIQIITQIIQLVWALIQIWRSGGSQVIKEHLAEQKQKACDKKCELLELKRQAYKENV